MCFLGFLYSERASVYQTASGLGSGLPPLGQSSCVPATRFEVVEEGTVAAPLLMPAGVNSVDILSVVLMRLLEPFARQDLPPTLSWGRCVFHLG